MDSAPLPTPADTRPMALHLEISNQALQLWERYGRPEGRDVAIWLEAERQVLGADPQIAQLTSGAVPAEPLRDTLYPLGGKEAKLSDEPAAIRPGHVEVSTGQPPS